MHYNKLKKKIEQMLIFMRRLGSLHSLSFTNLEILRDKIVGLDEWRRKLLIVEDNTDKYDSKIINLYEVKTCKVKKIYRPINSISFKKNMVGEYLSTVILQLHFKNNDAPFALVFQRDLNYPLHEMTELEYTAKRLEATLSRLL